MRIIKHKWNKISFTTQQCTKCGCEKIRQPNNPKLSYPLYYYYRNGIQLKCLPTCKL